MALGVKLPLKSNHNLSMHKILNTDLSRILKSSEIQRAHEDSSQSPEEESPEKLENHAEVTHMQRPHAGWNTIPPQDKNHKLWMNKAAAVSAKSDEEGSREETWGGEERKEGCWY